MKAKEKAKELFNKFRESLKKYNTRVPLFSERSQMKSCALILIDEIIKESMTYKNHLSPNEIREGSHIYGEFEERIDYWDTVKSELQKL